MRLQLALNVDNLDRAIEFYGRALGVGVHKREPGYASFVMERPAVKLVLFENPDAAERLNHVGFEVFEDAQVAEAAARLSGQGLDPVVSEDQTCCYARQNKAVLYDPQGLMWEWYRVLADSPTFFDEPAAVRSCC